MDILGEEACYISGGFSLDSHWGGHGLIPGGVMWNLRWTFSKNFDIPFRFSLH
jgi:hypothetical protein